MQHIVPSLAEQDVVAVLAEQQIVARAAGDRVVTRAAEQLGGWQRTVSFVERNGVVARLTEHLNHGGVTDGGLAAVDANGAVVDENSPRRVAADDNAIVEAVTNDEQRAGAWGIRCGCSRKASPSKDISRWEGYLRADRMSGLKASFRRSWFLWSFSGYLRRGVGWSCGAWPTSRMQSGAVRAKRQDCERSFEIP